jgi:hypothetical protein
MANICRTDVKIEGTPEAINYFVELYENCNDGKYPNEGDTPHIVDVFGAEAENFIDKVGSKWVTKYDIYGQDETSYEFGLESAWYPPSDMLKEMHRQLVAIDPDIIFTARYWDEAYDPIGVLKITDAGQYLTLETEPESEDEFEGEYYWDDVIDPAFRALEKKLNIA